MIKILRDLLGKDAHEHGTKKPAPKPSSKPSRADRDYRAVSLAPNTVRCAAAKDVAAKRFLMRDAPRLPLAGCTMPTKCSCKFHKDSDRRDGDRRLFGALESVRWFAGPESRKRISRRSDE